MGLYIVDLYFVIWLSLAILIAMVCTFMTGFSTAPRRQKENMLFVGFACAIFWPFIATLAPIVGAFFALYKLGRYVRAKVDKPLGDLGQG